MSTRPEGFLDLQKILIFLLMAFVASTPNIFKPFFHKTCWLGTGSLVLGTFFMAILYLSGLSYGYTTVCTLCADHVLDCHLLAHTQCLPQQFQQLVGPLFL